MTSGNFSPTGSTLLLHFQCIQCIQNRLLASIASTHVLPFATTHVYAGNCWCNLRVRLAYTHCLLRVSQIRLGNSIKCGSQGGLAYIYIYELYTSTNIINKEREREIEIFRSKEKTQIEHTLGDRPQSRIASICQHKRGKQMD